MITRARLSLIARKGSYFLAMPLLIGLSVACLTNQRALAVWSIATGNDMLVDTSGAGFAVGEMSGVTYLGPSPTVGKHRFLTVQDNGDGLVALDVAFDLSGNLVSVDAVSNQTLNPNFDFEGIAKVGSSVYLSEETGPGVREYDPTTGNALQNVNIPTVFTDNSVNNLGFESLALTQSNTLWTASESALTIDGSAATSSAGTTVRLLELELTGGAPVAGRQFAYNVEPVHEVGILLEESGLVELVAMPDGALLSLERSAFISFSAAGFLNRIYEIDFSTATNVSHSDFDSGLSNAPFISADKGTALWSEPAGGGNGQNLEGLTVGPRLPNGDYILLGVVDDGGDVDALSQNTIVSLIATPTPTIPFDPDTADFDQDNDIDGADFLAWQRGFNVTTLAGLNDGDGNYDGAVTGADLNIWKDQYGTTTPPASPQAVPEPTALALLLFVAASGVSFRRCR